MLVLDAAVMLERQDLTIARLAAQAGRALVIVANKWDAVRRRREALARLRDRLDTSLTQYRGVPVVTLSALTGEGFAGLMPIVLEAHERWCRRLPTGPLNRWLAAVVARHPPPMAQGRVVKPRYLTQIHSRPPRFALFVNRPRAVPESYLRYLANELRDAFELPGLAIRIEARRTRNPYVEG